jgi:hypothetical protein
MSLTVRRVVTGHDEKLAPRIVTTYLVVHKGQIPCKRYCKLGRQTPYSRHQQRRGRYGAWSRPMPEGRCSEELQLKEQMSSC